MSYYASNSHIFYHLILEQGRYFECYPTYVDKRGGLKLKYLLNVNY